MSDRVAVTFSTQNCWELSGEGFIGTLQMPTSDCLVVAHLVCGLVVCAGWLHCSRRVSESVGALERLSCRDDGSDWDFQWIMSALHLGTTVFLSGLKTLRGSPAPRLVLWRGGGGVAALLGWLVCCSGWAAFPGGPAGTVKSFGEPRTVGMSNCLVGAM